jgi:hypothetical protein
MKRLRRFVRGRAGACWQFSSKQAPYQKSKAPVLYQIIASSDLEPLIRCLGSEGRSLLLLALCLYVEFLLFAPELRRAFPF